MHVSVVGVSFYYSFSIIW